MLTHSQARRGRGWQPPAVLCYRGLPAGGALWSPVVCVGLGWGTRGFLPPPLASCTQSPAPIAAFIDSFCTNKAR